MYTTFSESDVRDKVSASMAKDPSVPVSEMSKQLNLSEGAITFALPDEMVTRISGEQAQTVLEQLPEWGNVTTIVHSFGSIFETKAPFPKGKVAHGYYNLMGREGELHGHLRLDLVANIAFVSKPFRGMESHYIAFFTQAGECVFKIYLGRDKKRQLIQEQISAFKTMKKELSA
ncbi:heme utilization cystosolic carrier protein HutX [Vibrio japonicus]|uniref:Heme utilization cystosolic carrier protein HutX n=1 Tax=Vibrio japonicus TaxID=1824638 RepID=A0ABY5LHQ8_9VIBR|nr:heme utilization cystosolic carrier protein HutX [Vibrio japonicus]UUM31366.1 heme utilization cystosolic carrier protein HutX [Vibrio japonicus]